MDTQLPIRVVTRLTKGAAVTVFVLSLTVCGGKAEEAQEGADEPTRETAQESTEESTEETAQSQQETEASGGEKTVEAGEFTLSWSVENENAVFTLKAPTEGWVAVGFHPERMMKDANLIIGYVENGTASVRDDFGDWYTSHSSDRSQGGSDDVTNVSGTENAGSTTISFTLPLDSGDQYDQPLVPGEKVDIIFAYGSSDDFTSLHESTEKTTVTF